MSDFLNILNNHRELLEERGYDEIGLGSPDKPGLFMEKLEFLFSTCVHEARFNKEKRDFFIEAYGFFENDNDLVVFKFHYEFDPEKKDIELKSFLARMDGIQRPFFLPRNMYQLPFASRVYRLLANERQTKLAKDIVNHEPSGTDLKQQSKKI